MNRYEVEKVVGQGSYGRALLCRRKIDNKKCIIKQIAVTKLSKKELKLTEQEASLLSKLSHPNIVTFIENFLAPNHLNIVMEYADGGDLSDFIKKRGNKNLAEQQVLHMFVQISLAMKHVHDRKILHRDLKAQNVFLTSSGIVKLGDFGVSRVLKNTGELASTQIGTPYYMSPEIMEGKKYNSKTDIWSLGCILYELTCLRLPFDGKSMKNLCHNIINSNPVSPPTSYSSELRALIQETLAKNPKMRPSINTILSKPVMKQRISSFLNETKLVREFSHTILHGVDVFKSNQDIQQPSNAIRPSPIMQPSPSQQAYYQQKPVPPVAVAANPFLPPQPKPAYVLPSPLYPQIKPSANPSPSPNPSPNPQQQQPNKPNPSVQAKNPPSAPFLNNELERIRREAIERQRAIERHYAKLLEERGRRPSSNEGERRPSSAATPVIAVHKEREQYAIMAPLPSAGFLKPKYDLPMKNAAGNGNNNGQQQHQLDGLLQPKKIDIAGIGQQFQQVKERAKVVVRSSNNNNNNQQVYQKVKDPIIADKYRKAPIPIQRQQDIALKVPDSNIKYIAHKAAVAAIPPKSIPVSKPSPAAAMIQKSPLYRQPSNSNNTPGQISSAAPKPQIFKSEEPNASPRYHPAGAINAANNKIQIPVPIKRSEQVNTNQDYRQHISVQQISVQQQQQPSNLKIPPSRSASEPKIISPFAYADVMIAPPVAMQPKDVNIPFYPQAREHPVVSSSSSSASSRNPAASINNAPVKSNEITYDQKVEKREFQRNQPSQQKQPLNYKQVGPEWFKSLEDGMGALQRQVQQLKSAAVSPKARDKGNGNLSPIREYSDEEVNSAREAKRNNNPIDNNKKVEGFSRHALYNLDVDNEPHRKGQHSADSYQSKPAQVQSLAHNPKTDLKKYIESQRNAKILSPSPPDAKAKPSSVLPERISQLKQNLISRNSINSPNVLDSPSSLYSNDIDNDDNDNGSHCSVQSAFPLGRAGNQLLSKSPAAIISPPAIKSSNSNAKAKQPLSSAHAQAVAVPRAKARSPRVSIEDAQLKSPDNNIDHSSQKKTPRTAAEIKAQRDAERSEMRKLMSERKKLLRKDGLSLGDDNNSNKPVNLNSDLEHEVSQGKEKELSGSQRLSATGSVIKPAWVDGEQVQEEEVLDELARLSQMKTVLLGDTEHDLNDEDALHVHRVKGNGKDKASNDDDDEEDSFGSEYYSAGEVDPPSYFRISDSTHSSSDDNEDSDGNEDCAFQEEPEEGEDLCAPIELSDAAALDYSMLLAQMQQILELPDTHSNNKAKHLNQVVEESGDGDDDDEFEEESINLDDDDDGDNEDEQMIASDYEEEEEELSPDKSNESAAVEWDSIGVEDTCDFELTHDTEDGKDRLTGIDTGTVFKYYVSDNSKVGSSPRSLDSQCTTINNAATFIELANNIELTKSACENENGLDSDAEGAADLDIYSDDEGDGEDNDVGEFADDSDIYAYLIAKLGEQQVNDALKLLSSLEDDSAAGIDEDEFLSKIEAILGTDGLQYLDLMYRLLTT